MPFGDTVYFHPVIGDVVSEVTYKFGWAWVYGNHPLPRLQSGSQDNTMPVGNYSTFTDKI